MLLTLADPVAALDPIPGIPIPAEPEAVFLPASVTDAMVVDLDGDGDREMLVITGSAVGQGLAAVQVWGAGPVAGLALLTSSEDRSPVGSPVGFSNRVPVRRSASVDELLSGRGRLGIDRDNMIAVRMGEPAKFLLVRRNGRQVPLVAAIGTDTEFDVPCCLTIWEVVIESGSLGLRLVADTQRFAAELVPADLDGDGTDELLVTEGPVDEVSSDILDVSLLRWTGERYPRTGFSVSFVASCCSLVKDVGETDGVPGDEVLITAPDVNMEETVLLRISLRGNLPTVERGAVGEAVAARGVSLATGPNILTSDGFAFLRLWSWPRDGAPEPLPEFGSRTLGGQLAAVFGTGDATRIVVISGVPPGSVQILSGDLWSGPRPSLTFGRDIRGGAFTGTVIGDDSMTVTPYFGVVPGGLPGASDAFVFSGQLIRPLDSLDDMADSVSIALLPGLEPVGRLGPSGSWVALRSGFTGFELLEGQGPVSAGQPVDLRWARPLAALHLVSTGSLMEPETNGADLEPTFHGVAPDPNHAQSFIVGDEAVEAEVHGPPGTTVSWSTRGDAGQLIIGSDGVVRIQLLEAAGPNAPEGSGATASIWAVTPAGHAYAGIWRIRVYRQPPPLAVTSADELFSFSPTVSGLTTPGITVTVNGRAVDVADDGSFEAPVVVGLLPTDVRVVAV
ncbi:MAG: hypothetical protein ACRDFR_01005, partial [Candidatus Limnocylindria bacterium]